MKWKKMHVGLMPLMMQVFHNNFTDGIGKIGFTAAGNRLFIHLFEGEEEISLEIGFVKAAARKRILPWGHLPPWRQGGIFHG